MSDPGLTEATQRVINAHLLTLAQGGPARCRCGATFEPPTMLHWEQHLAAEIVSALDVADLRSKVARAETAEATVASVEALADEWERLSGRPESWWRVGAALSAALADPAPVEQQDECVRLGPEVGHEDEGYSCVTHNMPWDECTQDGAR